MVSYTDLSPLKQPEAPVAVNLNDPLPAPKSTTSTRKHAKGNSNGSHSVDRRRSSNLPSPEEWQRSWDKLYNKVLYFKGVTEDALPELQQLFKSCRGIRLNVDPHESFEIAGNVEFRNVYDTEKAIVVLNNKQLKESNGTLIMSPFPDSEIGPPPNGGYICIKHIPEDATESTLYDFLRPSGTLYSCSIPTHPSGQHKRMAYACFIEHSYAESSITQLNFAEYLGNTISIQLSRPLRQPRGRVSSTGSSHDEGKSTASLKEEQIQEQHAAQNFPAKMATNQQNQNDTDARDRVASAASKPAAPSEKQQQQQQHQHQHQHQHQQQQQQQPSSPETPVHSLPQSPSSTSPSQSQLQSQHQQQSSVRRAVSPGSSTTEGHGNGLGGVIVPGKLFVTNLHPTVSHKELFALFKKYGYIQSARVSIDPATKKSRGHGIVQFSDPSAALEALRECQGADIKGRKITMYQYEHVNRQGSSPHTTNLSQGNHEQLHSGSGDYLASVSSLTASNTEPALEDSDDLESKPVPFPRSDSVSSMPVNDPLLDPSMLCNLSEKSRNEILTQKLISAVASNPAVDVLDASRIVDSFIKRPLEDVLAMLSDPGLLASEWEHEQRANMHMPQYMHNMATSVNQIASSSPTTVSSTHAAAGETDGVVGAVAQQLQGASVADYDDADTDEQQARKSRGSSGGIHLPNYDTETEEFIEMLLSKPENVRKMKLGSKLFPMIKGMGYSESTKLTVWILDHMSQDVRTLAYTLNDISKLREIVDEAQQAISTGR